MLKNKLILLTVSIVVTLSSSFSFAKDEELTPNLQDAIFSIWLQDHPETHLHSPQGQASYKIYSEEFKAVTDQTLTEKGKTVFTRNSDYVLNEILIYFKKGSEVENEFNRLVSNFAPEKNILQSNIPILNSLHSHYKIKKIILENLHDDDDVTLQLFFTKNLNVKTAAKELSKLSGIEAVEPNYFAYIPEYEPEFEIQRIVFAGATLYSFKAGWENCGYGCKYRQRVYTEVTPETDEKGNTNYKTRVLAFSGDTPPNDKDKEGFQVSQYFNAEKK